MGTPRQPHRLRRLPIIRANLDRYFVTLCTRNRQAVLANARVNDRTREFVAGSPERYGMWVEAYMLMPDHAHMLITSSKDSAALGHWVKAFKAVVGAREFTWQTGYFDHVLRSDESAAEKWDYIHMNPVRAGLVKHPEDWPYSGVFHPHTGDQIL